MGLLLLMAIDMQIDVEDRSCYGAVLVCSDAIVGSTGNFIL